MLSSKDTQRRLIKDNKQFWFCLGDGGSRVDKYLCEFIRLRESMNSYGE
jgi:hypothetical protein